MSILIVSTGPIFGYELSVGIQSVAYQEVGAGMSIDNTCLSGFESLISHLVDIRLVRADLVLC